MCPVLGIWLSIVIVIKIDPEAWGYCFKACGSWWFSVRIQGGEMPVRTLGSTVIFTLLPPPSMIVVVQ